MTSETFVDEKKSAQELLHDFFEIFPQFNVEERKKIENAWNFLLEKSQNLQRACGKPYYLHPMRVAEILAHAKLDCDAVISAILHNILDCETQILEVESFFGKDVAKIVSQTSKITELKIKSKSIQQAASIRKMLFAMSDDVRVILVKLADRLDRMRNLSSISEESRREIAAEVLDIWAPFADRLGMQVLKSELEDLSLKYLNPEAFLQIKSIVAQKKDEREQYLENAKRAILQVAKKSKINVEISGRAKHFYSIYQKMRKRNKSADQLYDLLALRIICEKDSECYALLGIVHGIWKPLEGRFKDYIAMPKANGYKSLHTTVLCEARPLEIQIRTHEMHKFAEHGIASHWLYKRGMNHDFVEEKSLGIFNQLQELKDGKIADEEFFACVKNDLLGDEIFVFSPKGEVYQLPAGSTAIDFAYAVHSEIGQKISGAKADGKIIPLSVPLKNTQIVEILTSQNAHPTENQLNLAKTSKARQKIHAWISANTEKSEKTEKNPHEKNALQKSAKKIDSQKIKSEKKSTENLCAKIRVGETSNFFVTIAKCCHPNPGEKIVGYVSRMRGVVVHKCDCAMYQKIPDRKNRSVEITWDFD